MLSAHAVHNGSVSTLGRSRQLGLQPLPRNEAVQVLRAFLGRRYDDARGDVSKSNRRVCLVPVLTARARTAVRVFPHIRPLRINRRTLEVRRVKDDHRHFGRVPPPLLLGVRNALDPMGAT
jgi:hypothetical protein